MKKFTKQYQVEVSIETIDTIHDEKVFNEALEETINETIGNTIRDGLTHDTRNTIVRCGERMETFLDQYEYPYAEVDITVNVVYHSLDSIGE